MCNWFGAGSAGLADPNSDSSIQSYANIYDTNWLTKGNCMIAPGVDVSIPSKPIPAIDEKRLVPQ